MIEKRLNNFDEGQTIIDSIFLLINVDNISNSPCKGIPDYIILFDLKAILVALVHFPHHHYGNSYPSEEKGQEKADD